MKPNISIAAAILLASVFVFSPLLDCPVYAKEVLKTPLTGKAKAAVDAVVAERLSNKPHILNNATIADDMMAAVDGYIQHEVKILGGAEYKGERYMAEGILDSCAGASCCVVLYLIDGVPGRSSTNYVQYLATFTTINGTPQFLAGGQVGGKGLRWLKIKSVGPDKLRFNCQYPLPKDTGEQRSGKGQCDFVIASRHLIELPAETSK